LVVAAPLAVVGEVAVGNLGYDVGAHDTKCWADGDCDSMPTVGGDFLGACVNVQKEHAGSLQRDGQKPPLHLYHEAKGLPPMQVQGGCSTWDAWLAHIQVGHSWCINFQAKDLVWL
jgi:hypothetical protein